MLCPCHLETQNITVYKVNPLSDYIWCIKTLKGDLSPRTLTKFPALLSLRQHAPEPLNMYLVFELLALFCNTVLNIKKILKVVHNLTFSLYPFRFAFMNLVY